MVTFTDLLDSDFILVSCDMEAGAGILIGRTDGTLFVPDHSTYALVLKKISALEKLWLLRLEDHVDLQFTKLIPQDKGRCPLCGGWLFLFEKNHGQIKRTYLCNDCMQPVLLT